jgi:N-acetylmuramoyl-L-alanine amidase
VNFLAAHTKHNVRSSRWFSLSVIAIILLLLWPTTAAWSESFVVYFPGSHSILPIKTYHGVEYLPLVKLLNLFGQVEGVRTKKKSLSVWLGRTEIRLREKNRIVQLDNAKLRLSNPPRIMDGEWMVPIDFITQILPMLTNQTVEYQTGENRVFIGNVRPNSFTIEMQPLKGGARLIFQFTEPIELGTAARNSKWILYLGNHPVEPIKSNFEFRNAYVSRVQFEDQDGHPKLVLTPTVAGLDFYPDWSPEKKILVTDIMNPKVAVAQPAPALPRPSPGPQTPPGEAPPPQPAAAEPLIPLPKLSLPAVVLDPGHGGSDPGARGGGGLLEKDLTAQIVARVSKALQATGRYRIVLTRTGDQTVDFEQRATETNTANPIAFISFHAGNLGPSTPHVMVYTYQPSSPVTPPTGADPPPLFIPWTKVQLYYLTRSRQLGQDLQQSLERDTGAAAAAPMEAPVRVLRSIAAPAVAIEVGSFAPDSNPAPLTQPSFQDQIATAVVQALGNFQGGRW